MTTACASSVDPRTTMTPDQAAQLQPGQITVDVQVPDVRKTLPETLRTNLMNTLATCMTGSMPANINVRVDNYKEQNGAMTVLLGDHVTLVGLVTFTDAQSGRLLGEYRVSEVTAGAGVVGLAILADAENGLSKDFSGRICKEVFKS
ncbi:hypothetical protein FE88_19775 [Azospirillum brasilense]|nr:hypothetical protein FE88_19775 [Azospirillum brasilense]